MGQGGRAVQYSTVQRAVGGRRRRSGSRGRRQMSRQFAQAAPKNRSVAGTTHRLGPRVLSAGSFAAGARWLALQLRQRLLLALGIRPAALVAAAAPAAAAAFCWLCSSHRRMTCGSTEAKHGQCCPNISARSAIALLLPQASQEEIQAHPPARHPRSHPPHKVGHKRADTAFLEVHCPLYCLATRRAPIHHVAPAGRGGGTGTGQG